MPWRSIDVFEAGLRERLAHLVHVEPELALGEPRALVALVGLARRGRLRGLVRDSSGDDDDAIRIGDDDVAGLTSAPAQTTGMLTEPSVALTVPRALTARENTGNCISARSFTSRTPPSMISPLAPRAR